MINFDDTKKTIIVADKDYFPFLFRYKNLNPELNVKFVDLHSFIDDCTFIYLADPIPFLMENKHIEYNKARKITRLLQCPDVTKNNKLNEYFELLKGNYIPLANDSLSLMEYRLANIYLFECDENLMLMNILKKNKLDYKCIHFADLGVETKQNISNKEVVNFKTKFDQYFYLFSTLRNELKNKNIDERDNYKVLVDSSDDVFYVNYFSKVFAVPVLTKMSKPLSINKDIIKCLKQINLNRSFDIELNHDNNEEQLLQNIIVNYKLKDIAKDDFDFAYLNLLEILSSKNIEETLTKKGVLINTSYNFNEKDHIYVCNFQYDSFYKEHKDNNVISDKEIIEIGGNPSYVLTKLDCRKKTNYISYLNIALLSRVEQHLDEKIYDSQLIKKLNLKVKNYTLDKDNLLLTDEARDLYICYKLDSLFYLETYEKVRSYDHSFKGFATPYAFSLAKKQYSVSSIKSYLSCPFSFLMQKLLPCLDEEKHQLWKGTLIHKVFENIYDKNFDYEESFELGKIEYIEQVKKDGYEFTKKEEIIIKLLHHWLKPIALQVHNELETVHFIQDKPIQKDTEFEVKWKVGNNNFHGFVDKMLFTTFDNKNYYTIVDYKSGSHNSSYFDPVIALTGYDIQLPFYVNAVKDNFHNELENFELGGFGIRHNYGSTIKDAFYSENITSTNALIKKLKIEGLFNSEPSFFKSFGDNNVSSSNKINPKNLSKNMVFGKDITTNEKTFDIKYKKNSYKITLSFLMKNIEKRVNNVVNQMINNEFAIAPISSDIEKFDTERLSCAYCSYRDICYRKISDAKDLRSYIDEALEEL